MQIRPQVVIAPPNIMPDQSSSLVRGVEGNGRNLLLISSHDIRALPWGGVAFEFLDVVSQIETAAVVAPTRAAYSAAPLRAVSRELAPLLHRLSDMARAGLGLSSARFGARADVDGNF